MDNKHILEKAIRKAIDGGWLPKEGEWTPQYLIRYFDPTTYIYDHDFAKALWGIQPLMFDGDKYSALDAMTTEGAMQDHWRHHLQQMVIADDPIKYLGDNL